MPPLNSLNSFCELFLDVPFKSESLSTLNNRSRRNRPFGKKLCNRSLLHPVIHFEKGAWQRCIASNPVSSRCSLPFFASAARFSAQPVPTMTTMIHRLTLRSIADITAAVMDKGKADSSIVRMLPVRHRRCRASDIRSQVERGLRKSFWTGPSKRARLDER